MASYDAQNDEVAAAAPSSPPPSSRPAVQGGSPPAVQAAMRLKNREGAVRVAQWFCSLVAFAALADSDCGDGCTIKWDDEKEWQFSVAIHVMVWLYASAVIGVTAAGMLARVPAVALLVADALLGFFSFNAAIVTAARCDAKISGVEYCSSQGFGDKPKASAAFAFFTSFLLAASAVLGVLQARKEAAGAAPGAGVASH